MAGKSVAAINQFDLYSCFPCAVLLAAETLGIDWHKTPCTVTGGLPFFGGAGNNYSMHAIATMAERLRASPGDYGLVLANGGFLSRSEEHTSELQSLMRISYAVFCLKKKKTTSRIQ